MTPKTAIATAFALGATIGAVATWSWSPQAAQPKTISVDEIDGFDDRVRDIVERCLIIGAGTTMARITCRLQGL